jgi:hypothetical protein
MNMGQARDTERPLVEDYVRKRTAPGKSARRFHRRKVARTKFDQNGYEKRAFVDLTDQLLGRQPTGSDPRRQNRLNWRNIAITLIGRA